MRISLRNYRAFADGDPAVFDLGPGFTAFLGSNNAGKSSILRSFFELRGLLQQLVDPGQLNAVFRGGRQYFSAAASVKDPTEMFHNKNDRPMTVTVELDDKARAGVADRLELSVGRDLGWQASVFEGDGRLEVGSMTDDFELRAADKTTIATASDLIACCRQLASTLYVGPFRNVINVGSSTDYFDIQVGQAFVSGWRQLKTGTDKAQNEAAYELTETVRRVFGFRQLEINASADGETLSVLVDGRSYRLGELGAGLSQLIIVLVNAAAKRPDWILLDEPENSLHPTLQLDFLTTVAQYAAAGVAYATHSIGLARSTADRIYSVSMSAGVGQVRPLNATVRLSEFLGELNFAGFRELGFAKVLLVEGISDVRAYQQLLRLYRKDHQVVILPAGGSEMFSRQFHSQLEEVKRLTPHVFAVIDSERSRAGEDLSRRRSEFVQACAKAHIRCHVLERRAIENYFTDAALSRAGMPYESLSPFEGRTGKKTWPKAENWRIAAAMTQSDLRRSDLNGFLESL